MKKTLILFILLSVVLSISAQNKELSKYINEEKQKTNNHSEQSITNIKTIIPDTNSHTYKAGEYLEKSSKFEYGAIGTAACSGIFAILGANKTIKDDNDRTSRKSMYAISGLFGASALVCTIIAIDYRIKAGKELKLSASGNSAAIAYTF